MSQKDEATARGIEEMASVAPRLQFIDGLRGVAVLMVVCFHAAVWGGLPMDGMGRHYLFDGAIPIELGHLRHVLSLGGAGVNLFLAISGFCLFWPLLKTRDGSVQSLKTATYLKRRIGRIYPPYLFALALVFACSYLTYLFQGPSWWPWRPASFQNAFPWQGWDSVANVTTHLLLIHGFFNAYINAYEGAYWSLSLEWQFYFLFIPLAWVARRAGVLWAVAIPIFVTIMFRAACSLLAPEFLSTAVGHLFSLSRWVEFGAGMLAAVLVSGSLPPHLAQRFAPLKPLRVPYFVFSIGLALFLEYGQNAPHLLPFAWGNASAVLLTLGAQKEAMLNNVLQWRPLIWLGSISYSLYLTHGTVYMAMALLLSRTEISRDVRQAVYLFLGPGLAIAFAALFFRCCEKPFLHRVDVQRKPNDQLSQQTTAAIQDRAAP